MNKTETRIYQRLQQGLTFSADGVRESNAARSLVEKGLAVVVAIHQGCSYSRHGYGRGSYARPHYRTSTTIKLAK